MKKVTKTHVFTFALIGVLFILSGSCKKNDNTPTLLTVTDVDGNIYHTVKIGTQVWMVENLKTTRYNDHTLIPLVSDSASWISLSTPGYCWYNNDGANYKNVYGALYNWFTVNTGKLAPAGWHVPSDAEWTTLISYLGGDSIAGGKMKAGGTLFWVSPNTGADNSSGFSALPGGYRYENSLFFLNGACSNWWATAELDASFAWYRAVDSYIAGAIRGSDSKTNGYSVRCIKD